MSKGSESPNPRAMALITVEAVTREDLEGADTTVEWLMDGVMPAKGLAVLAGFQGLGKTTLLTQVAFAIAGGLPLFGRTLTDHPGKVVMIGYETSAADYKRRIDKIYMHYKALGFQVNMARLHHNLFLYKENDRGLEEIIADEAMEYRQSSGISHLAISDIQAISRSINEEIKLFIIDPVSGIGLSDEVAPSAAYGMWRGLRGLHSETDGLVLLTHHLIKSAQDGPLHKRLSPVGVRGGGHMTATPRIVMMLVGLTSQEARKAGLPGLREGNEYAVLGLEKYNEGPCPTRCLLRRDPDGLWDLHPDDQALKALIDGVASGSGGSMAKKHALLLRIHESTKAGKSCDLVAITRDLWGISSGDAASMRSALRHLVEGGLVEPGKHPVLTAAGLEMVTALICEVDGED